MGRAYTTVSSKGQMVIPAAMREALGIEPGTRVAIRQEGTRLILEPETLAAKLRLIKEMRGCTAGYPSGTEMLLEDRRLERQRELEENGW
ncbi:MAG: AbrB/MazE/SpoVT family DNA-binding domain-containing protein [Terracidiphilus sp.]